MRWPWSRTATDDIVDRVAAELRQAVTELQAEANKLAVQHPPKPANPKE